jgi:hypothetical protein
VPAAAREQHDQRYAGGYPDGSLQRELHFVPPFPGLVSCLRYRVGLRDRRRFKKSIMMPIAAIHIVACIIVPFIVCALLFCLT